MKLWLPLSILIALSMAGPAAAHPHIFVDARAKITFDQAGEVVSIHNEWTFDEAYSAWAVQGLDANKDGKVTSEELQSMANDNAKGLADYGYYTFAGEGATNLIFGHASNPTLDYENGRTTLNFDIALEKPYAIRNALELAINDPQYYVAMTFAGKDAVTLANAPANCTFDLEKGHPMSEQLATELFALPADVTKLPPDLETALRGVQGGILIKCAGGSATGQTNIVASPTTALDATNQLAASAIPATAVSDGQSAEPAASPLFVAAAVAGGVLLLGGAAALAVRSRRR